jgi:hypothetical protein
MVGRNDLRALPQRAFKTGRMARICDYLGRDVRITAAGVKVLPAGERTDDPQHSRRQEDNLDWKTVAPRWFVLSCVFGLSTLAGGLFVKVQDLLNKDQQRLEAAIADAPSKYQARLSERVAIVEADQALLRRSVDALTAEVKTQNAASGELTTQLRLLTAEVRRLNVSK